VLGDYLRWDKSVTINLKNVAHSRTQENMFHTYILVGGAATLFHYLVVVGLVEIVAFPAGLAAMLGAFAGACVAYLGNRRFTFTESTQSHSYALPRFFLVAAVGALLNGLVVWLGSTMFDLHYFASQLMATLLLLFLTFTFNRLWTFQ
jgi:putative flippase GtrA